MYPTGTSVNSVIYDKSVHSASHYGQWGTYFWHVVRQILWKIHEYHSHFRPIPSPPKKLDIFIIGYSARKYFKLTLKRILKN